MCVAHVVLLCRRGQAGLHWGDYLSLAVWIGGFLFETTADVQKYVFKQNPKNKGRYIDAGLWSLSRHPNYFGEICMWMGVSGVCLSMASSPGGIGAGIIIGAVVSPIFVTFLITRVSGVPILERTADERWGAEAEYQAYKRKTPLLIPKAPCF